MRLMFVVSVCVISFALISAPATAHHRDQRSAIPRTPLTDRDFRHHSSEKVELGRNLMFDKILSGNRNISCGTCHHSLTGTGDGLSLPVGQGGIGLGIARFGGDVDERVPRNAPAIFNLGAHEFEVMFHDGRVQVDPNFPSGCKTPADVNLPSTLESVLACQAMFPVTSAAEMAGAPGTNSIADATAAGNLAGPNGVWDQLAQRLQGIPEYVRMFIAAFPGEIGNAGDITYAHAANALAAFEDVSWRADDSPFDRYLRGDRGAMSRNAIKGMRLFYRGDRNRQSCGSCHSGRFQTDHQFHAIAMPQIGPGRGSDSPGKTGGHEDFGREQVTGDPYDTFKFRTPTLRNVALTAPYGHAGAYRSLRSVVYHHLNPVNALFNYDQREAILTPNTELAPLDFITMNDPDRVQYIAAYNELPPFAYSRAEVDLIIDFLHALTDRRNIEDRNDVPFSVPSGLPVHD